MLKLRRIWYSMNTAHRTKSTLAHLKVHKFLHPLSCCTTICKPIFHFHNVVIENICGILHTWVPPPEIGKIITKVAFFPKLSNKITGTVFSYVVQFNWIKMHCEYYRFHINENRPPKHPFDLFTFHKCYRNEREWRCGIWCTCFIFQYLAKSRSYEPYKMANASIQVRVSSSKWTYWCIPKDFFPFSQWRFIAENVTDACEDIVHQKNGNSPRRYYEYFNITISL